MRGRKGRKSKETREANEEEGGSDRKSGVSLVESGAKRTDLIYTVIIVITRGRPFRLVVGQDGAQFSITFPESFLSGVRPALVNLNLVTKICLSIERNLMPQSIS